MLIEALRVALEKACSGLTIRSLFKTPPTLFFDTDTTACPHCKSPLSVIKTTEQDVATLAIGHFVAHETIRECTNPLCDGFAPPTGLATLVPQRGNYGYDVIVFVGTQSFIECRNELDIVESLRQRGISISRSEIGVLARKFVVFLWIAHQQCRKQLKAHMGQRGGYILHLDGTCDADSPHLMSVLDGISELVLDNIKLPSENAEQIIPFLLRVKRDYGMPLAVVSDMAKGIRNAVKTVFASVPHFICHFHFLRDIGKDLLSTENDILRKRLRSHGIVSFLRKQSLALKPVVEHNASCIDSLRAQLSVTTANAWSADTSLAAVIYVLIQWALAGKHDGDGYGFPFDRPYLLLCQRLRSLYEVFDGLKYKIDNAPKAHKRLVGILWKHIGDAVNDPLVKKAIRRMEEKCAIFDRLRQAMRIALPDDDRGLNDNGEKEMNSIRHRISLFQQSLAQLLQAKPDSDFRAVYEQIQLYWKMLFADPIVKNTPCGSLTIYPQRTNNILERFFRSLRRNHRKRQGTNTMTKTLKAILTDTPLIANLSDKTYRRILLNGAPSLEARFAKINVQLVREKLRREEQQKRELSPKVKQIIHTPELINKILQNCGVCK